MDSNYWPEQMPSLNCSSWFKSSFTDTILQSLTALKPHNMIHILVNDKNISTIKQFDSDIIFQQLKCKI